MLLHFIVLFRVNGTLWINMHYRKVIYGKMVKIMQSCLKKSRKC